MWNVKEAGILRSIEGARVDGPQPTQYPEHRTLSTSIGSRDEKVVATLNLKMTLIIVSATYQIQRVE